MICGGPKLLRQVLQIHQLRYSGDTTNNTGGLNKNLVKPPCWWKLDYTESDKRKSWNNQPTYSQPQTHWSRLYSTWLWDWCVIAMGNPGMQTMLLPWNLWRNSRITRTLFLQKVFRGSYFLPAENWLGLRECDVMRYLKEMFKRMARERHDSCTAEEIAKKRRNLQEPLSMIWMAVSDQLTDRWPFFSGLWWKLYTGNSANHIPIYVG